MDKQTKDSKPSITVEDIISLKKKIESITSSNRKKTPIRQEAPIETNPRSTPSSQPEPITQTTSGSSLQTAYIDSNNNYLPPVSHMPLYTPLPHPHAYYHHDMNPMRMMSSPTVIYYPPLSPYDMYYHHMHHVHTVDTPLSNGAAYLGGYTGREDMNRIQSDASEGGAKQIINEPKIEKDRVEQVEEKAEEKSSLASRIIKKKKVGGVDVAEPKLKKGKEGNKNKNRNAKFNQTVKLKSIKNTKKAGVQRKKDPKPKKTKIKEEKSRTMIREEVQTYISKGLEKSNKAILSIIKEYEDKLGQENVFTYDTQYNETSKLFTTRCTNNQYNIKRENCDINKKTSKMKATLDTFVDTFVSCILFRDFLHSTLYNDRLVISLDKHFIDVNNFCGVLHSFAMSIGVRVVELVEKEGSGFTATVRFLQYCGVGMSNQSVKAKYAARRYLMFRIDRDARLKEEIVAYSINNNKMVKNKSRVSTTNIKLDRLEMDPQASTYEELMGKISILIFPMNTENYSTGLLAILSQYKMPPASCEQLMSIYSRMVDALRSGLKSHNASDCIINSRYSLSYNRSLTSILSLDMHDASKRQVAYSDICSILEQVDSGFDIDMVVYEQYARIEVRKGRGIEGVRVVVYVRYNGGDCEYLDSLMMHDIWCTNDERCIDRRVGALMCVWRDKRHHLRISDEMIDVCVDRYHYIEDVYSHLVYSMMHLGCLAVGSVDSGWDYESLHVKLIDGVRGGSDNYDIFYDVVCSVDMYLSGVFIDLVHYV